jgi:hypothetical protein
MRTADSAPLFTENTTGFVRARVSNRGDFETQELTYLANEVQCLFGATAQRGSSQSIRSINIDLDANITSGTYEFGSMGTGMVKSVVYSEMVRSGFFNHYLQAATTERGSLTLHIENDNQLYRGTFSLTAKMPSGLAIAVTDAEFAFYIPKVPAV